LIRLSDDLLDTEQIAQGKLKLRQERIELRQLIDGACEEIRPFIDQCGHTLTVNMDSEAIMVLGDPSRMLQVFANLIQNAAKFTGRHGSLCVTVGRQEGMAVVVIRDNGNGIKEDKLQSIFETFAQVNVPPTINYNGLGIRPTLPALISRRPSRISRPTLRTFALRFLVAIFGRLWDPGQQVAGMFVFSFLAYIVSMRIMPGSRLTKQSTR
jgi:K+-sensing histidine kinase KdpD